MKRVGGRSAIWYALTAVAVAAITPLALSAPTLALLAAGTAALAAITFFRPTWLFPLFMVAAFMTLPDFVPRVLPLLGVGLYLYEPFLYLAVGYLLLRRSGVRVPRVVWVFAVVVVYMLVVGLVAGNDTSALIPDLRPLVDLVIAAVGAYLYLAAFPVKPILRTTLVILWVSMCLTLLASLGGLALAGRAEENTADTARLITAATYFALAVLTMCVAGVASGSTTIRTTLPYVVPAATILLVAFSRNTLVVLGVAMVWALIAAPTGGRRVGGFARLLGLLLGAGLIVFVILASGAVPWLQAQLDGFTARVLGGLSTDSALNDGRDYENLRIWPVIMENPLFGHGLGATYKEAYGPADGFYAGRGMSYAHNFFYWLALKGGLIAILAFAAMVLPPMFASLRAKRPELILVGSTLVAFTVVSIVVPMPIGFPTAALYGLLVGAAYFYARNADEAILSSQDVSAPTSTSRRSRQPVTRPQGS